MKIEDWKHLSFPVAGTEEEKAADESKKIKGEEQEQDELQDNE